MLLNCMRILILAMITLAPCLVSANGLKLDQISSLTKASNGQFKVLVEFNNVPSQVANGSARSAFQYSQNDAHLMRVLRGTSGGHGLRGRFIKPNLRTLSVTTDDLVKLLADDGLIVYEDKFHKPSLASSVDVIFPNQASSSYVGAGQVVALLDTGVAKNHRFLTGAVIANAEACFSTEDVGQGFESLCPNNAASMIGSGAAASCASSISGCEHGTQMAGVIAGRGASFDGVAPATQIIPVQVYTRSNEEVVCGIGQTPCIGALTSNIIEGLNYIDSINGSYSIAAVNLSLGSTATFQGQCDVFEPASYTSVIADLVSSGIAVIAASGNAGQINEMSSPACLSDVIAVAATSDSDVPLALNNRNSELDFFAPGYSVTTSSLPGNAFARVTGTSISAAHVSGAWAVMKSKTPNASVALIRNTLASSGKSITQGLFTKRRINLTLALDEPRPEADSDFLPSIFLLLLDD